MLTQKEKLLLLAEKFGLTVYETLPPDLPINGLYIDNQNHKLILMKPTIPDSKYIPVLAEEIGHHISSSGVLLELDDINHVKSENYGRAWAIDYLLPVCKFAFASALFGCKTSADYAEFFSLDEEFVKDAIQHHKRKGHWGDALDRVFHMLVKPDYEDILSYGKLSGKEVV
jgi:hypothetical protein